MKKFILLFCVLFSSCSTYYVGTITTYSSTGEVLKRYKDVIIGSDIYGYSSNVFKPYGINFYDEDKKCNVVISNSTPYTIEYKSTNRQGEECGLENNITINDISHHYNTIKNKIVNIKSQLTSVEKNSDEYKSLRAELRTLTTQKIEIENYLWEHHGQVLP